MVSLQAAIAAIALSGAGQTVLLDFYADWCGPCKAMNPTVQSLVAKGYPVQRVNIDQNRPLAAKYRIQSIPCFVMVVDGREVDRVVGGTTFSRLERMCKAGAAAPAANASPAMLAQNGPPAQPVSFPKSAPPSASPFDNWENPPAANQPAASPAPAAAQTPDAALLAASVRLRVEDATGHSCGSGTIIDARSGEALILTCGHIFRDSKGKGRIEVDLFGPNGQQRVEGRLISYDSENRDIGLVAIQASGPLVMARVAPPGYKIGRGMSVVSVGCNNGDVPTVRHSQVTSLDKFMGPPNIQVAGQPVEGRSGGGLFSSEGYVIGVCNAADPSDKEGLFAAMGSIQAELDRSQLAFVYQSPSASPTGVSEPAVPAPNMPQSMPGPADLASFNAPVGRATEPPPAVLRQPEQAALDEIHRREKEGAEVVCIIRPRDNPAAKSEVIVLDHASPEFVRQLSAAGKRQDKQYQETSLELPKPRRILLEWSAEMEGGGRKAEGGNAGR